MKNFNYPDYASLFFLVTVGFMYSSCQPIKDSNMEEFENPQVIETGIEEYGILYGYGSEGFNQGVFVLKSIDEWNQFLAQIDLSNQAVQKFSNLELNFEKEMVVAYFDKVRTTGGYSVSFVNALLFQDKIQIMIQEKSPNGQATTVMTQPFFIVTIPTNDKLVQFEIRE